MLPTLRTARLVLRPLAPDDASEMQRHAGDYDVARMLAQVPHPYPDGEAKAFISEVLDLDEDLPFRVFAIDHGGFAGTVALAGDGDGFRGGEARLGYWLGKPFWGRGLATEAVSAVLRRYAFPILEAARVTAGVFEDNPASARVLIKLGFIGAGEEQRWSEARGQHVRHLLYQLTREMLAEALP